MNNPNRHLRSQIALQVPRPSMGNLPYPNTLPLSVGGVNWITSKSNERLVKAMTAKINQINETLALYLTKAFGTMWTCYVFMVYGVLPAFAILHPYRESFLYWSNWVQLWSLPLI